MSLYLHSGTRVGGIRSSFVQKDRQSWGSPKDIIILVHTAGFCLFVSNSQICRASIKLVLLEKKLGFVDHTEQNNFLPHPKISSCNNWNLRDPSLYFKLYGIQFEHLLEMRVVYFFTYFMLLDMNHKTNENTTENLTVLLSVELLHLPNSGLTTWGQCFRKQLILWTNHGHKPF